MNLLFKVKLITFQGMYACIKKKKKKKKESNWVLSVHIIMVRTAIKSTKNVTLLLQYPEILIRATAFPTSVGGAFVRQISCHNRRAEQLQSGLFVTKGASISFVGETNETFTFTSAER